jgi:hypothetical protein
MWIKLKRCEWRDVCCSFCRSCMYRKSDDNSCCGPIQEGLGLLMRDGSLFRGLNLEFLPGVLTLRLFDDLPFGLLSWLRCRLELLSSVFEAAGVVSDIRS